jgi:hypothetical protein
MEKHSVLTRRERALEEAYFRAQDARLLEKLRAQATLGELANALKEKLEVDDPQLLLRIRDLGLTQETGAALLLAPFVQVAWAEGSVSKHARSLVLEIATLRGLDPHSPAYATLAKWLEHRPSDDLFETALTTIREGLSVLTPVEQDERIRRIIWVCRRVAMPSADLLSIFGAPWETSHRLTDLLERIASKLRSGARVAR